MAQPDVTGLGMVALYPDPEEAGKIALLGGSDAAKLHVTMIFLGEVANIDLKAAARAVGSASGSTAPMSGKIGGLGVFDVGETGYPQIVLPSVLGLSDLRALLVKQLAAEGITSPSEHDWVPHMTLSYADEPELADLDLLGMPLTFNQISLVVADERKDFPLDPGGSADDHTDGRSHSVATRAELRQREILLRKASLTL
jgi:2'-5' RNA ligase